MFFAIEPYLTRMNMALGSRIHVFVLGVIGVRLLSRKEVGDSHTKNSSANAHLAVGSSTAQIPLITLDNLQ